MEPRLAWEQALGAAVAIAALATYAWALDRVRQGAIAAAGAWWMSTARDGVNLGGAAAVFLSLWRFGFPAPTAILLSSLLALAVYGTDYAARALPRPPLVAAPVGTALAAPVLVFADDLAPAIERILARALG
jgi:hypothetical protein